MNKKYKLDKEDTITEKHGDSLIAQEYLMVSDLMELRIKRRNDELNNND